jgi:hypothetical protein
MVELVDTQDLKSCDLKSRAGSIPALSTSRKAISDIRNGFSIFTLLLFNHSNSDSDIMPAFFATICGPAHHTISMRHKPKRFRLLK